MYKFLFIFSLIFAKAFSQYGVHNDSLNKTQKALLLPIVYRSPETGWAAGISAGIYFNTSKLHADSTRISNIQTLCMLTEKHQNVEALDGTIYFPKEKEILYIQSSHAYYPDKFWGIGDKTIDSLKEKYTFEQFYLFPHFKHKLSKHSFIGVLYEFQYVYNIRYIENGIFDQAPFSGKSNYKVSGLGGSIGYDTRNATYWPTKGVFTQILYTGFSDKFGSSYNLSKIISEARYFKQTFHDQVFAIQLYNYMTIGSNPLRELASLGGQNNMRGFYMGRYRDKCFYSLIAEYRIPIWNRISCVTFGGLGDVYKNIQTISFTNLKFSGGAGLRFALLKKEKMNLRLDYGVNSNYNYGLYLTVNECF